MADEMQKANNWVRLISPNTVKGILKDAGLWTAEAPMMKREETVTVSRTAEAKGRTPNVDLCFAPATHQVEVRLPAVSGSTGKLVIEHPKTEATETAYPGMVFANMNLDYVQAMTEYVAASAKAADVSNLPKYEAKTQNQLLRIEKQQLCREAEQLCAKRWGVRQRRAQEDATWQSLKLVRRIQQEKRLVLRQTNKCPPLGSQTAENQHFKQLCQQGRTQVQQRTVEDEQWQKARQQLRLRHRLDCNFGHYR